MRNKVRPRIFRHAVAVFVAVLLMSALGAPTAAIADIGDQRAAEETATACVVRSGSLTWGFKESFRAYISGSIAKGQWEAIAPTSYKTPVFTWPEAAGSFDPTSMTGTVSFAGGVAFSGHDGLLDTTIENPTLVVDETGAWLLLDVSGVGMEDALAGNVDNAKNAQGVQFVSLDLVVAPPAFESDLVTATAVPTTITEQGFAEFGNYEAGTAFDPVSFTFSLDCVAQEAAVAPSAELEESAAPEEEVVFEGEQVQTPATGPSWLEWLGVGIMIVVVAGGVVAKLMRLRALANGRSKQ